MADNPATEHPDDTRARALVSLDLALKHAGVTNAEAVMLRDMVLPAWQEWCAAMQQARLDNTNAHVRRVAALMLCMNVFWETVVMTADPHMVAPIAERMLAQLISLIRTGPGR